MAQDPTTEKEGDVKIEHADMQTDLPANARNIIYDYDDQEPAIHLKTWLAVAALCIQHFAQQFAIIGPPVIVSIDVPPFCVVRGADS
jgi:hypothetical protein